MSGQIGTLTSQVWKQIRDRILNGTYPNGKELTELGIGKELGVSRTPVREALRQLELEGLVKIVPHKGAVVTGISAKDVRDIYIVRSHLEGLCARMAVENATDEQISDMEEIVFLSEYHGQKEHFEQVFELDGKFHDLMYESSKSKILCHLLSDYHEYIKRVRKVTVTNRIRAHKCNEEHHQLVDAIRARDADRAEKLAVRHILNSIENMSQYDLEEIVK